MIPNHRGVVALEGLKNLFNEGVAMQTQTNKPVATTSKPADDIDTSLRKMLSDGKARSANEMRQMLVKIGHDSFMADRRVDALIHSRNWFDRKLGGTVATYSLKKHLCLETKPVVKSTTTLHIRGADIRRQQQAEQHQNEVKDPVPDTVMAEKLTQALNAPKEGKTIDLTLKKSDTTKQMVWKITHDGAEYKRTDIVMLIQTALPHVTTSAITNAVGELYDTGILKARKEHARLYWYSQPKGTSMPVNPSDHSAALAQLSEAIDKAKQAQAETAQTQSAMTSQAAPAAEPQVKHEPLVQIINQPKTPDMKEPPLLDLTIGIKGQRFNFQEAEQLVTEVRGMGWLSQEALEAPVGLIEQTITIKGVVFTRGELITVALALNKAGFR